MMRSRSRSQLPREGLPRAVGSAVLLMIAALAVAGPAGLLAWRENARVLKQREGEIAKLSAQRDVLRNRVDLIDPRHADPDLVGELLRRNLNVAHPDEIVVTRP